jgi:uncharacterized protein YggU (UPF0235/DUF167 family)
MCVPYKIAQVCVPISGLRARVSTGKVAATAPLTYSNPMKLPDLSDLAVADTLLQLRVTPKAARNSVTRDGAQLRAYVTAVPENGKANAAVIKLLSKALGIPKSRLQLVRGDTSRDKQFRILP